MLFSSCIVTFFYTHLFFSSKKIRDATNCPTFVLATSGPWIVILGAVFTDGLIIQRLTDYIWVGLDSTRNEIHIARVARIFYALRNGLENLKSFYEGWGYLAILLLRRAIFLRSVLTVAWRGSFTSRTLDFWKIPQIAQHFVHRRLPHLRRISLSNLSIAMGKGHTAC